MPRYIDADELYSRVKTKTNPYGKPTLDYESGVKVLNMIKQAPTADVIPKEFLTRKEDEAYESGYAEAKSEIIRCKDCTRYEIGLCLYHSTEGNELICDPDDFCSAAIRRATDDQG